MRRQLLIAGGVAIALILIMYVALIKPKAAEVKRINTRVEEAERTEQDLRLRLRQLQQAKANAPATQAQLARFGQLLPSTPDLATFIRQLQVAANSDGVDLTTITPSPPSPLSTAGGRPVTGVETISVNMNVRAGFFRMESFLAHLEDLQRVVEVRAFSVTPSIDKETGLFTLQSTIALVMYVVHPGANVPGGAAPVTPAASPSPSPSPTASPTTGGTP